MPFVVTKPVRFSPYSVVDDVFFAYGGPHLTLLPLYDPISAVRGLPHCPGPAPIGLFSERSSLPVLPSDSGYLSCLWPPRRILSLLPWLRPSSQLLVHLYLPSSNQVLGLPPIFPPPSTGFYHSSSSLTCLVLFSFARAARPSMQSFFTAATPPPIERDLAHLTCFLPKSYAAPALFCAHFFVRPSFSRIPSKAKAACCCFWPSLGT